MTQVDFHFNAPDKWLYISRLLRKANSQGKRVGVWGESPLILRLDQDLWQLGPTDFVSHCMVTEPSIVWNVHMLSCRTIGRICGACLAWMFI